MGYYLKRVTTLSFAVDHFHDFFVYPLTSSISLRPVVACSATVLGDEYIFRIVQICERRCEDIVNDLDTDYISDLSGHMDMIHESQTES